MVKKKVLILGGAGFIGFSIAKYLLSSKNYEITIADIFNPGQEDALMCVMLGAGKPTIPNYPPEHPLSQIKR